MTKRILARGFTINAICPACQSEQKIIVVVGENGDETHHCTACQYTEKAPLPFTLTPKD